MIDDCSSDSESDFDIESEVATKKIKVDSPADSIAKNLFEAHFRITFESPLEAQIACNSLQVDREPKRGQTTKSLCTEDNILNITLRSSDVRNLRTASNSLLDFVALVQETIRRFR